MRCRCPFATEVALVALTLLFTFTAGAVHAQVTAGGKLAKGAARLEGDPLSHVRNLRPDEVAEIIAGMEA